MNLGDIATSAELQKFYDNAVHHNWVGTKWEAHAKVPNKAKGSAGEIIIKQYFSEKGNTIKDRLNEGHDFVCNNKKLELKFSMAKSVKTKNGSMIYPNNWMFNHIEMGKDWTHILFVGINPPNNWERANKASPWEEEVMLLATKKDFMKIYKTEKWYEIFRRQQGGTKSENDDWLIDSMERFNKLMKLPFVIKNPTKIK